MNPSFEVFLTIAFEFKERHQECVGGVVIWEGEAYAWKDSLRDAGHERPGVHAIDEAGNVFIAEGGDDYNAAKCWVVVDKAMHPR
ncbi:antirestriction protein ArdR [Pseudomonas sp.]|uniref:antirestriction protein ArdR n=1 Tax=Pseudomonas sp. TaxID=306 RepID=UPI0028AE0AC3|nr:antirestriction protein ArdR [Pseudomonas sp.]